MIYFYGYQHHRETTLVSCFHGRSFLIAWATNTFINLHHRCRYVSVCAGGTANILNSCSEHQKSNPTNMPQIHTCSFAENKNQPILVKGALMQVPPSVPEQLFLFWKTGSVFPYKIQVKNRKWIKYMQMAGDVSSACRHVSQTPWQVGSQHLQLGLRRQTTPELGFRADVFGLAVYNQVLLWH